ncbi:MAG: SUMF1/EgtB/PvdO family nonheme iron enzyme, partial [Verrucomicrobiota bacterium]
DQTGIGHTSAVGAFPLGRAECGVEDTSGNVMEWCDSWWDEEKKSTKTVRGGSFWYTSYIVRCARRDRFHPDLRGNHIGFRLVRRPQ